MASPISRLNKPVGRVARVTIAYEWPDGQTVDAVYNGEVLELVEQTVQAALVQPTARSVRDAMVQRIDRDDPEVDTRFLPDYVSETYDRLDLALRIRGKSLVQPEERLVEKRAARDALRAEMERARREAQTDGL